VRLRTHGRATSRLQPKRQVLLVALVVAAVAATGCGRSYPSERTTMPSGGAWAGQVPLVVSPTPSPLALDPSPHPVPAVHGSASLPSSAPAELDHGPGPRTMPAATPVRLQIPTIGVDSTLIGLGLQADGTLEVPSAGFPAGWYTGSPTPGELGPAIIAGHVDWAGRPGVFSELRDLTPDDEIVIVRQDGSTARFRVSRVERFDKEAFPTQAVYGDLDHAGLRLITCGGEFDRQARRYRDNVVVFAELTSG
jgi:hypothetical protein